MRAVTTASLLTIFLALAVGWAGCGAPIPTGLPRPGIKGTPPPPNALAGDLPAPLTLSDTTRAAMDAATSALYSADVEERLAAIEELDALIQSTGDQGAYLAPQHVINALMDRAQSDPDQRVRDRLVPLTGYNISTVE